MTYSLAETKTFLRFGYLPKVDKSAHSRLDDIASKNKICVTSRDLESRLLASISSDIQKHNPEHIYIPMGGGLDSRIILGGTLKLYPADKITLITYGVPGLLDYDLGISLAQKCGFNHLAIDLSKLNWSDLVKTSRPLSWYVEKIANSFPIRLHENALIIVGYMGDPSTGSHLHPNQLTSQEGADLFLANNIFTIGSLQISEYDRSFIEEFPYFSNDRLSFYEQLDFSIRQAGYIEKLFCGDVALSMPFDSNDWLDISINMLPEQRLNQEAYINFGKTAFPDLFRVGVKNKFGKTLDYPDYRYLMRRYFGTVLSIVSGGRYGAHKALSNYFNFCNQTPVALSGVEKDGLERAFSSFPALRELNLSDRLFKSLASSIGLYGNG